MRKRFLLWALLLIVVFLVGLVPMYSRYAALDGQYKEAVRQIAGLQLRDSAAILYFEAVQKNYGLAAHSSTEFFNRVQRMASQPDWQYQKQALDELFGYRDKVTALLARGDPAVLPVLQDLYVKTRAATTP